MLVVLLGFLIVMLVGAFLLALPISNTGGKWMKFPDAAFTASSAVCVTGLIVRPTAVAFSPFGQAVLIILIQIGGLGIMTLATLVFIILGKRITLKDRLAIQEALGQDHIKGIVRLVRNIAVMTGIIELAGILLLIPVFCYKNGAIGIWQAVFTSISAFCNAGFDIMGTVDSPYASLTDFKTNPFVLLVISALIIFGGLGFTVIREIKDKRFKYGRFSMHTKIVLIMSLILIVFGTLFFLGSEFNSPALYGLNGGQKLINCFFQSVTARTAGFNAVDQNLLSGSGKTFTCILMFIGASPGGTGGGIKTTTFAVIILAAFAGICGKDEIVVAKNAIKTKTLYRAFAITVFAALLVLICVLAISATDGSVPSGYIVFDVVSAFGTVGLSMGICPALTTLAKFLLMLVMFIGRLGPLSIGMIFARRDRAKVKYPSGNIMIG